VGTLDREVAAELAPVNQVSLAKNTVQRPPGPGDQILGFIDGEWSCCWPQARAIWPITPPIRAEEAIISE